jgi:hypothetical protein
VSATIRVPGYSSRTKQQLRLSAPAVGTVVLPWWPDEVAASNLAGVYEEQPRPGRRPLLLRSGDPLPEMRIGCIVSTSNADRRGNVAKVLSGLRRLAVVKTPVTVKLATRSGRYRIVDLAITELEWDSKGQPSNAEVSLTLTTGSDAAVPVGPIKKKPKR